MNNVYFPKLVRSFFKPKCKKTDCTSYLQSDQSASTSIQEDENTDKKEN